MNQSSANKDLHASALRLLTRREHSAYELQQKLIQQGYAEEDIVNEIQFLQEKKWQSDERFTESFVHYRQQQNKGPLRIKQELKQRGIAEHLINKYINDYDEVWFEKAKIVCNKKIKLSELKDIKKRAKAYRYLQYAGYTSDHIQAALKIEE